jgi:hypothetical protein
MAGQTSRRVAVELVSASPYKAMNLARPNSTAFLNASCMRLPGRPTASPSRISSPAQLSAALDTGVGDTRDQGSGTQTLLPLILQAPVVAPHAEPQSPRPQPRQPVRLGSLPPVPPPPPANAASPTIVEPDRLKRGQLRWSGRIQKDQILTIADGAPSFGQLTGELPGTPIVVIVPTRRFELVERPAVSNGWRLLKLRAIESSGASIVIHWREIPSTPR